MSRYTSVKEGLEEYKAEVLGSPLQVIDIETLRLIEDAFYAGSSVVTSNVLHIMSTNDDTRMGYTKLFATVGEFAKEVMVYSRDRINQALHNMRSNN